MERVGVLLPSGVLVVVERIVVGVLYRPVVRRPNLLAVVPLGVQWGCWDMGVWCGVVGLGTPGHEEEGEGAGYRFAEVQEDAPRNSCSLLKK